MAQPLIPPFGIRNGGVPPTPVSPASQPSPGMGLGSVFNRLRQQPPTGMDFMNQFPVAPMAGPGSVHEAIPGVNVPVPEPARIRNQQVQMPMYSATDAEPYGQQVLNMQDSAAMGGWPGPLDTMTQMNYGRPFDPEELDDLQNQVRDELNREIAGVISPQDRVFPMATRTGLRSFKQPAGF